METLAQILGSASSAVVIFLHRFVLEHVQSHDSVQDQENAPISPDPFLVCMHGGVWE